MANLFTNKVFYRTNRTGISDSEKQLISSILSKNGLETNFLGIEIVSDDLFGTLFLVKFISFSYIIRLTLNHGLWASGDALARSIKGDYSLFFNELASGTIESWEYAVFESLGPRHLIDANPETRTFFSRLLGAASFMLSNKITNIELPFLIEAYDKYFDLCDIFEHAPAGAQKSFLKRSPITIEELKEFTCLVREDFVSTLNNLPEPPKPIQCICLGPLDTNYVFFDPYLKVLPTLFPHVGNPYIDIAINSRLLGFSQKEAVKTFCLDHIDQTKGEKYVSYISDELWQPLIINQMIKRFIGYSFESFPVKSVVDVTYLYSRYCRNKILNFDKYKKFRKSVDNFFLKNIIY